MVAGEQRPTINSQKTKYKQLKAFHYGKSSTHMGASKKGRMEQPELQNSQKINKMALVGPYLPGTTVKENGMNSPVKGYGCLEGFKEQDQLICCLQEPHYSFKDTHRFRLKRWKMVFHATGNQKTTRVAIFIQ